MSSMDDAQDMFCNDDLVNPLSSMGMQVSCILVVSHFFNVVLRTMGQPGPIAQILAGLILGPMSHIPYIKETFFPASSINYYQVVSFFCRINFMFLFGLEMNIHYTLRHWKMVTLVACGGALMGGIIGLSVSFYLHQELTDDTNPNYYFYMTIMLMVSYTSSPMVIRLTAELRFAASDIGRIAVSSALITEMACLLFFNVIEGKTARTLLQKLGYSIYNFVLPVYFGYLGLQCDLINVFTRLNRTANVAILILLSIGSKLGGTLIVCRYLHIPTNEGIFLGFMLNTRGYADLLFIGAAAKQITSFDAESYNVLLVSIVLNTIISGIIVSFIAKGEEKMFSNNHTTIEPQEMEDELKILACVYDPRQVSAILATILAIHGSKTSPSTTYLMHLIELVKKIKSNLLYHEKENGDISDDDEAFGGNDVVDINNALDTFTEDTKILVQQKRTVSSFLSLYEEVCSEAENLQVSIILLPFHKHQRIDGKLESGKEGIRITNQKVLRHAPCSVGVIIERGLTTSFGFSELIESETIQNVATLFFGGPDDREAVAWSLRISKCPRINLTIIRFLLSSKLENEQIDKSGVQSKEKEILMSLSGEETANDEIDNNFMVDFYNRHVASGKIGYVENFVKNGRQTVECLKEIGDIYSLFIVGKGGRGNSSLTIDMSDWEECPELGSVGDILASSDFDIHGSVLVIQQHRDVKKGLIHD
ncbi:cation/H(+) antiporter 2 [Medicago truncatula]|uniref:cation/H(+) antiporter 2 n=1 Tax=Medicago truncatula TaxID=3880 RepID=UPI000D2F4207|nr:cation/H(+) antiporter 2 [Medicago truncatula]